MDDARTVSKSFLSREDLWPFWQKVNQWREVYRREKGEYPDLNNVANMSKSCLLGRLLIDGKEPLPEPPPVLDAAPWYWFVEEHGNTDHNRHRFARIGLNGVRCVDCDEIVFDFKRQKAEER